MKRKLLFTTLIWSLCFWATAQEVGQIGELEDIDGNIYETIYLQDGNWWMLENLEVRTKPDGTPANFYFPWNGTSQDESLLDKGAGLVYDRNQLMGWPHPLRAQGLCPDGWHVPTIEEFVALEVAMGGKPTIWGWEEDNSWVNIVSVLKLGERYGGKYDPAGVGSGTGSWDANSWGPSFYISTNTWANQTDAHMLVMRRDGVQGAITMDPPSWATNCRCVKDRDVTYSITNRDVQSITVEISDTIISKPAQVEVWNVTVPNDQWMVIGTNAVLSENKKIITISGYFLFPETDIIEIRFRDTQDPKSYIGGYNLINTTPTSVNEITSLQNRIYPTPATDRFFVETKYGHSLSIYQIDGKLVRSENITNESVNTIDISTLLPGIYIVKIAGRNGTLHVQKLIRE